MSLKDIRKHTIGAKSKLAEVIKTFEADDGTEYDVMFRQPTRKVKREILAKSMREDGNVDPTDLSTWSVILLTLDPETKEPVFGEEDYDIFMEQSGADSFVDQFAEHAMSLINGIKEGSTDDPKELPEA